MTEMPTYKLPSADAKPSVPLPPLPNAIAYRLDEVARMGGPRKTTLYTLAARGQLKLVRVSGRTLVDGDSLRHLLTHGTRSVPANQPKK